MYVFFVLNTFMFSSKVCSLLVMLLIGNNNNNIPDLGHYVIFNGLVMSLGLNIVLYFLLGNIHSSGIYSAPKTQCCPLYKTSLL